MGTLYFKDSKKGHSRGYGRMPLAAMALNLKRMAKCHLSLSPNLLFCWGHDGFQLNFYVCQQVPYCTLSRLYIWNGALYNKREVLRHAAQAACPSEKQMLDIVLNGNTVFFARTSPKHTRPREGRESSCRRMPTVWMGAARTVGAFSNLDVFGSRRGGSGILPTHACE